MSLLSSLFRKSNPISYHNKGVVDRYYEETRADALHASYERKELLKMAGVTPGADILIAASGPGIYAALLYEGCNSIVALDQSEAMLSRHREILDWEQKIMLCKHDLNHPLPLSSNRFDHILSPLSLQYLKSWEQVFSSFYRVLKPGGELALSVPSPMFIPTQAPYHETLRMEQEMSELGGKVLSYRRPLSSYFNAALEAGFSLAEVGEPIPDEDFQQQYPKMYDQLKDQPIFLFMKWKKAV